MIEHLNSTQTGGTIPSYITIHQQQPTMSGTTLLTSAIPSVTSTITSTDFPLESSTVAADTHSFVGTSAFYFVVVGIPVIILVAICVLAGCCCCCTGLSYRAIRQRRQEKRQGCLGSTTPKGVEAQDKESVPEMEGETTAAKSQPPATTLYMQQGGYISEMSGSMGGPPPRYDVVDQQQGIVDNDARTKV